MLALLLYFLLSFSKRNDSVIVVLSRNSDKVQMKKTIQNFEEKFNKKHNYPYVFFNDKDWDSDFQNEMRKSTKSKLNFQKIDAKSWNPPDTIDYKLASKSWAMMETQKVPYVTELSYHNMCRFYSKDFFRHPSLQKYKYYWRLEPGVRFRCLIEDDPFEKMAENNFVYGFTISLYEFPAAITTLGKATGQFLREFNYLLPKNANRLTFMFENGKYNGCHFWSNFEIADFDFFRSELYTKYVDFLDEKGGFYYERWGDAPIHSLAAALFTDKSKIHFFEEIGYTHPPFTHCPKDNSKCDCVPEENFDGTSGSCLPRYFENQAEKH